MRKLYRKYFEGQSPKDWGASWNKRHIGEAVDAVSKGHYYQDELFSKYFQKGQRILEGGCGLGQFVIHYYRLGYDIIGLDFSEDTVKRIKNFDKSIPVLVSDVLDLPFEDNTFDIYYSGGVVEHFEEGPVSAIKEAYRVIKPGGKLIITVPHINSYRMLEDIILKAKAWFKNKKTLSKKRRFGSHTEDEYFLVDKFIKEEASGFHLYAFKVKEFKRILVRQKFRIITHHGTSVLYGLRDMEYFNQMIIKNQNQDTIKDKLNSKNKQQKRLNQDEILVNHKSLKSSIRELLFHEKTNSMAGRLVLRILQRTFGNLVAFVCTPEK